MPNQTLAASGLAIYLYDKLQAIYLRSCGATGRVLTIFNADMPGRESISIRYAGDVDRYWNAIAIQSGTSILDPLLRRAGSATPPGREPTFSRNKAQRNSLRDCLSPAFFSEYEKYHSVRNPGRSSYVERHVGLWNRSLFFYIFRRMLSTTFPDPIWPLI